MLLVNRFGLWCVWTGGLATVFLGTLALRVAGIGLDPTGRIAVSAAFALIVGLVTNDLRRWSLGRAGFVEVSVVAAPDADTAEQRFLDLEPGLAADMAS